MIDTLRADFLSVYGASEPTPAMARLANDGVAFEQAISQAPWTRPSVATQLTSLPPHRHGARAKATSIDSGAVLLPEVLAAAGYYCVGLYHTAQLAPQWGFARGYHRYRLLGTGRKLRELVALRFIGLVWRSWRASSLRPGDVDQTAEEVFRVARAEWEAAPKNVPIFLFVHLMDVHDPYFPRAPNSGAILRDASAPGSMRDIFRRAYREGVTYADSQLGDFMQWMQANGLYEDTLIVLVSDHGEEFFEHGGYWHGFTLYEEQIHVPLILKLPQNHLAGSRQPALVRLLDLAPTIAAVAGVPQSSQWTGIPLIRDGALVDPQLPYALSETDLEARTQRALRGPKLKMIRTGDQNPRMPSQRFLFDLEGDAGEQVNLAAQQDEERKRLEAELTRERDGDLWR
jgi:arylsulfatase A-like enzyme